MPNSAEPTTAILAAPPRKLPIADIARSEKKSAPPVRASTWPRMVNGMTTSTATGQDRADHPVHVEAEIDDHALRRDVAGLEIARQVRADEDVGRHRQDDADEAPARGAPARVQDQKDQKALPTMPSIGSIAMLVGQRLVADRDVAAERSDSDHRGPVAPVARARGVGDEGERKREAEADGEQLLGVEGKVEDLRAERRAPTARRRRPAAPEGHWSQSTVAREAVEANSAVLQ